MIFTATEIEGVTLIELAPVADERGQFMRTYDAAEWEAYGLPGHIVQCNVSRNTRRGTLRGMHYQVAPRAERKLVRCTRGAIFDVAVDLRPASPTFRRWVAFELSDANDRMLFIDVGLAHGFLTLADGSEVEYRMFEAHSPGHARGVRWDDPAFAIEWPASPTVISARDRGFPDFAA